MTTEAQRIASRAAALLPPRTKESEEEAERLLARVQAEQEAAAEELARLSRSLPARQRRRPVDIDHVVEVAVNVPFPSRLSARELAEVLASGAVPDHAEPQVTRLLEELDVGLVLRFCRRHGIRPEQVRPLLRRLPGRRPAIQRPELEQRLDELLADS